MNYDTKVGLVTDLIDNVWFEILNDNSITKIHIENFINYYTQDTLEREHMLIEMKDYLRTLDEVVK